MLRTLRVALATLAIQVLVLSSIASARTDVVADPYGDVAQGSPGYVDIVHAKVTEQIGNQTLFFQLQLAGQVPETPTGFLGWNWLVDLPGGTAGDFGFVVRWCSQALFASCGAGPAHWESGRIAPTGGQIVQPFDFKISGATVKAYVDTAQIGSATGFGWRVLSRLAPVPAAPIDLAPDGGASSTFNR